MLKMGSLIGLLAGVAVAAALVAWQGFASVATELAVMGWAVFLLPLAFMPSYVLMALAWQTLFLSRREAGLWDILRARWMASSVNVLLPMAGIGGEVVRARVLLQAGVRATDVYATMVVDKTTGAISLALWGLIGIAFLLSIENSGELATWLAVTLALLAAGITGFVVVQQAGTFGYLARLFGKVGKAKARAGLIDNAVDLDAAIRVVYGRRWRVVWSCLLWLLSRVVLTAEVWLAAALMGQAITLWDALMLRSLIGILRGATFIVPGGWGIQEAGYVVLGGLLGLTPDFMLAISLATRARMLMFALPGVLAWQHLEGRSLWKRLAAMRRR
jgi:putative membrane protein